MDVALLSHDLIMWHHRACRWFASSISQTWTAKQSKALRCSWPFEASVHQKVSHRHYLLLPWRFRDAGSWCSESHWRQISCMVESFETSAAWRTSWTCKQAFTGFSFTASRYADLSLLHIRYAFIYTHKYKREFELDDAIKTLLKGKKHKWKKDYFILWGFGLQNQRLQLFGLKENRSHTSFHLGPGQYNQYDRTLLIFCSTDKTYDS